MRRVQKAFSLLEALVVILLISIVLAISVVSFSRSAAHYRQTSVTRRVAAAITLARMKAVSTNMDYTFHMDATVSPNNYVIIGTNDTNGNAVLDPWEDVDGTGRIITDRIEAIATERTNPPAVDHQGLTSFPEGLNSSEVMDPGTTLDLVFNGKGNLKTGGSLIRCIVLQNGENTQAVTIGDTGRVRMYKYTEGWIEMIQ